ncbi:MAG: DnaJ domain-containing protein [Flavipsychrobacter sp.]
MNFNKDHYSVLGVGKSATKEEIKAAYRALVKKNHPDKNKEDSTSEDKIKEINEAYGILGNEVNRHIYDEYLKGSYADEQVEEDEPNVTYKKSKVKVNKEYRTYLKGTIIVKYKGDRILKGFSDLPWNSDFLLDPIDVYAVVKQEDIYSYDKLTTHFKKAFSETKLFKVPLPQPIRTTIITKEGQKFYNIKILDIKVASPKIMDVVYEGNSSYGTIRGDFYGYVVENKKEYKEKYTKECFGETGNIEEKEDRQYEYIRKEYFHKDCSSYWGPWERIRKVNKTTDTLSFNSGCSGHFGNIPVWLSLFLGLFILIIKFKTVGLIVATIAFLLLIVLLGTVVAIVAEYIGYLLIVVLIIIGLRGCLTDKVMPAPPSAPSNDSITVSETVHTDKRKKVVDTLITHRINWRSYDDNDYQIDLTVSRKKMNIAVLRHANIDVQVFKEEDIGNVYKQLSETDNTNLSYVYSAFDSIRVQNSLDRFDFANLMVSCVQNIPFYIVLEGDCNKDDYSDEYVQWYLSHCVSECCIGHQKYGVRSPIEFLGDMKGDCDTRSLLLYNLFRKFDYDVALLVSAHYQHALIAVNLEGVQPNGVVAVNIDGKKYYLWETTDTGFEAGNIPIHMANMSYWKIALLSNQINN